MARGYPDWSPGAARSHQDEFLPSIAEAPSWFEDDFESPVMKWAELRGTVTLDSTPGGAAADSTVYEGSACLKMLSDAGLDCATYRYIGVPPGTHNQGVAFALRIGPTALFNLTNADAFTVQLQLRDTPGVTSAGIGYNPTSGVWSITEDAFVSWVPVLTHKIAAGSYHLIKFIYNMTTLKYVALYVDNQVVDLTAYTLDFGAFIPTLRMAVTILITSKAASQAYAYIDQFKVTYGES